MTQAAALNENTLLDPELLDSQQSLKLDIFRNMNCVKIGQVTSFDPSKKTIQAAILGKRVLNDGTLADYPALVDCPVFTLQGGGGAVQLPIAAGDNCILLFNDRNIDAWYQNGSSAAPYDARCHDISDAIALVGVNSQASDLRYYDADTAGLLYSTAEVSIRSGLITFGNETTTLLTLINGLLDLLAALTVQDGSSTLPLTAASIAAINAYKLLFAGLLE